MVRSSILVLVILVIAGFTAPRILAQATEFVYQGQLQSASAVANGTFDFEFALFDGGGSQVGPTLTRSGVAVANGIFAVNLDFGSSFPGASRFLEIRVRQSGGGSYTTLSPRQSISSAPYSVKSLNSENAVNATNAVNAANATNATNATNAVTATNFTGTLSGDVTGTQGATTVARLQNRTVAAAAPAGGQVLKFNSATNQWQPDTDLTGSGGGGTITGVTPGAGLAGGGTTGNVTLSIAPGGVGITQLADGGVIDAKINTVSGSKVTGSVANATNAATATDALSLGGVAANQYLQSNGNGSGLTNLNATNITTGTLANARLGQIPTANIADSAVTALKIAPAQVVKTLNGLTDAVTLAGSGSITVTPTGNTLTIASTAGGVGGSGNTNTIPVWTGGTTVGNSVITQNANGVQLPNGVQLAAGAQGNQLTFGSPNGETGLTIAGAAGRADLRFDGNRLRMVVGPAGGPPAPTKGLTIFESGHVVSNETGTNFLSQFQANGTSSQQVGVVGTSVSGTGVVGLSDTAVGVQGSGPTGVVGQTGTSTGTGVRAVAGTAGGAALATQGSSWFKGDTTPLSATATGTGTGIVVGSSGNLGYIQAFDYSTFQAKILAINNSGGNVGINTTTPDQTLTVNGNASKSGGGSWLAFSDERLKNIKGNFKPSLAAVMKLQPLRYRYKKDNAMNLKADDEYIGFSAQAVEKVIPEAVTKNEQGYRLVNNDPIMWTMLNAIKEQQAEIQSLKAINTTLIKRLGTIERSIRKPKPVVRSRRGTRK